jgi:GrpB-like predicted nucleotidyltransferase (UPF0157 family)
VLTKDEKDYLSKIPAGKKVSVNPFNPRTTTIAEEIITSVKNIYPHLEVIHMGASALGISGQNDIDIYAFSDPKNFDEYLPDQVKLFGEPLHKHETFYEWKFKKEGFDIEFYLTAKDSKTMKRQIAVFEVLKNNKDLLKKYEKLKASMNGKSFREYQEKKYEFYNLILCSSRVGDAINFLIKSINTTGHNPKPVIFHSLKVAMNLLNLGYGESIVVAALLHDLIEDSDVKYEDIKEKFSKSIADLVSALSFDLTIVDRNERDRHETDKAVKFGRSALIIKAADFIDNSYFYHLTEKELYNHLLDKLNYFLEVSKPIIGSEIVYKKLKELPIK